MPDPGPQLDRLDHLLEEALNLPLSRRLPFLREACGDDPALQAEVISLLEHAGPSQSLFSSLQAALGSQPTGIGGRLSPGDRLGRYVIQERLGGGVAGVYRVVQKGSVEPAALKVGEGATAGWSMEQVDARIKQEGSVLSRLKHPASCRFLDAGRTESGRPFFVMELLEGQPLHTRLAEGQWPVEEILRGGAFVAEALAEAHSLGIIHRDVKPANLVLQSDGVLRILDFGAAKSKNVDLTAAGVSIGTLSYMSPEQLRGGDLGPPTDVWSLALVLTEALLGYHPFDAPSRQEKLRSIVHESPQLPAQPGLEPAAAVLSQALKKDPTRRPSAADFSVALNRL